MRRADDHEGGLWILHAAFDARDPIPVSIVEKAFGQRRKIVEGLMEFTRNGIRFPVAPRLHDLRVRDAFALRNEFEQQIRFTLTIAQSGKNISVLALRFHSDDW